MAVSNSSTDIVNLALDFLRIPNVIDVGLPGSDITAAKMNQWYDDMRQYCLEGFPWSFATSRTSLLKNTADPSFGYTHSFNLPSDFLSLQYIETSERPLTYYTYTIESGMLLMNRDSDDALPIVYTFDQTDVAKFSPSFKMYFAAELAVHTAAVFGTDERLFEAVSIKRNKLLADAKAKNGISNPPRIYRESKMLSARRTYSS